MGVLQILILTSVIFSYGWFMVMPSVVCFTGALTEGRNVRGAISETVPILLVGAVIATLTAGTFLLVAFLAWSAANA